MILSWLWHILVPRCLLRIAESVSLTALPDSITSLTQLTYLSLKSSTEKNNCRIRADISMTILFQLCLSRFPWCRGWISCLSFPFVSSSLFWFDLSTARLYHPFQIHSLHLPTCKICMLTNHDGIPDGCCLVILASIQSVLCLIGLEPSRSWRPCDAFLLWHILVPCCLLGCATYMSLTALPESLHSITNLSTLYDAFTHLEQHLRPY